jgi:hypothetical protein
MSKPDCGFLRTLEAARYLGVRPRTLEKWRYTHIGPPFHRLNGAVTYRLSDLVEWAQDRREPAAAAIANGFRDPEESCAQESTEREAKT